MGATPTYHGVRPHFAPRYSQPVQLRHCQRLCQVAHEHEHCPGGGIALRSAVQAPPQRVQHRVIKRLLLGQELKGLEQPL